MKCEDGSLVAGLLVEQASFACTLCLHIRTSYSTNSASKDPRRLVISSGALPPLCIPYLCQPSQRIRQDGAGSGSFKCQEVEGLQNSCPADEECVGEGRLAERM